MKGAIVQNFRGLHALVIHPDDTNRQMLVAVLGKLGLIVHALDAATVPDLGACDVIFADADEGMDALPQAKIDASATPSLPCIALVGNEAPSSLARIVRRGCASHILKPIRNTGVYTALLLAMNDHEKSKRTASEIVTLQKRISGRRIVTKAVVSIVNRHQVDPDTAYEWLRVDAMNRRLPIAQVAYELMATFDFGPTRSRYVRPDLDQPRSNHINRRSTL